MDVSDSPPNRFQEFLSRLDAHDADGIPRSFLGVDHFARKTWKAIAAIITLVVFAFCIIGFGYHEGGLAVFQEPMSGDDWNVANLAVYGVEATVYQLAAAVGSAAIVHGFQDVTLLMANGLLIIALAARVLFIRPVRNVIRMMFGVPLETSVVGPILRLAVVIVMMNGFWFGWAALLQFGSRAGITDARTYAQGHANTLAPGLWHRAPIRDLVLTAEAERRSPSALVAAAKQGNVLVVDERQERVLLAVEGRVLRDGSPMKFWVERAAILVGI
jgi:hypothetical protein